MLHSALNHGMICEREVIMSTTANEILDSFDHLAEDEKREVASEIIRRTRELELPPLQMTNWPSMLRRFFWNLIKEN